jgi:hypothetical protein
MTTKTKSKRSAFTPGNLRKHPEVQAAATVLVAQFAMHDSDMKIEAHESVPESYWEMWFKALGLSDGDPREANVADAIAQLALDMRRLIIKQGLLREDCAWRLQINRAA